MDSAVYVMLLCMLCPWPTQSQVEPDSLESVVMQQAQVISQLQAKVDALEAWRSTQDHQVAFYARMDRSDDHDVQPKRPLVFSLVDVNEGDGYDNTTGVFTAPLSGLYEFNLKLAHQPPGNLHIHVLKQGTPIAEVTASGDDHYHDRSSASVVTHVNEGERVYAANYLNGTLHNSAGLSAGQFQNTFMGILIKAD